MSHQRYNYLNGGSAARCPWPRKRKFLVWAVAVAVVLGLGLWFFLAHWVPGSRLAGYFPLEEIHSARVEVQDVATNEVLASKDLTPEETAQFRNCLEATTLWRQGAGVFEVREDATYVVTCLDERGATLYEGEFWGGRRMSFFCTFPRQDGEQVTANLWGILVSTPVDAYLEGLFP